MITAEEIIEHFAMKPLPDEGGYYVETYRSPETISAENLQAGFTGQRNLSTSILYLITHQSFSSLHRVKSDEVFHFYLGDPVTMLHLHPCGTGEIITLGQDITNGQRVQVTVPAGTWQGCFLNSGNFALMGTTVSPGFEFEDFEKGDREKLVEQYPKFSELITKLT